MDSALFESDVRGALCVQQTNLLECSDGGRVMGKLIVSQLCAWPLNFYARIFLYFSPLYAAAYRFEHIGLLLSCINSYTAELETPNVFSLAENCVDIDLI